MTLESDKFWNSLKFTFPVNKNNSPSKNTSGTEWLNVTSGKSVEEELLEILDEAF